MGKLDGKRIAFLVAPEGIEQVELTEPWKAVEEAGGSPELISTESGEVQAFKHLDKADTFPVDHTVEEADASDYAGLVLPGSSRTPPASTCSVQRTPRSSVPTRVANQVS